MKRSHSTISSIAAALVAAAGNLLSAQITYTGVGGRIEQQIAAIQSNVRLAQNGFVAVPDARNNRRVFVRFLADTGRNVSGFDINMRFTLLGEAVPAWLYAADAQNRPDTNIGPLLTGQIGIDTNMDYCRASFPNEYRIVANRL
jgi:hypothetical protein